MTIGTPLIGISVGAIRAPESGARYLAVRPTYPHAVEVAGGAPVLIPHDVDQEALRRIYTRLDGIILSGGGDVDPACYGAQEVSPYTMGIDPRRDQAEIHLVRWALDDSKPLLAICRGIQVLNVALGGTLIQDIREQWAGALRHEAASDAWFTRISHDVVVDPASRLHTALGIEGERLPVNSLHHQALDSIGAGLRVVARAGDGIVEGVEVPGLRFAVGVQWHPEALVDEHPPMRRLFEALVGAAQDRG